MRFGCAIDDLLRVQKCSTDPQAGCGGTHHDHVENNHCLLFPSGEGEDVEKPQRGHRNAAQFASLSSLRAQPPSTPGDLEGNHSLLLKEKQLEKNTHDPSDLTSADFYNQDMRSHSLNVKKTFRRFVMWFISLLALLSLFSYSNVAIIKQIGRSNCLASTPSRIWKASAPLSQIVGTKSSLDYPQCKAKTCRMSAFEFFNPSTFSLVGLPEIHHGSVFNISGRIQVRSSKDRQAAGVRVEVLLASIEPHETDEIDISQSEEAIHIHELKPKNQDSEHNRKRSLSQISVHAIIHVRQGLELHDFNLSSNNLNVDILPDTEFFVRNAMNIRMQSGSVISRSPSKFSSRETRISLGSGSVSGSYDLLDLLSIETESGSIDVDVEPKGASESKPKPARFTASSNSGRVHADFPMSGTIPDREYQTEVKSQSGSLSGTFIHGTSTSFISTSGSINVDVIPYSADSHASTLATKSVNGMTKVNVFSPYTDPDTAVKHLTSSHSTNSGRISLKYPSEWEGTFKGSTSSGTIRTSGKGVRVIRGSRIDTRKYSSLAVKEHRPMISGQDGDDGSNALSFQHNVVAEKGDGESIITCATDSGSIDWFVGL